MKKQQTRKSRKDDAFSVLSTNKSFASPKSIVKGIEFDYGFAMGEPRTFKSNTPVLKRLGVDKYDQISSKKITDL